VSDNLIVSLEYKGLVEGAHRFEMDEEGAGKVRLSLSPTKFDPEYQVGHNYFMQLESRSSEQVRGG
jgi:hypothetical protein